MDGVKGSAAGAAADRPRRRPGLGPPRGLGTPPVYFNGCLRIGSVSWNDCRT